MTPGRRRSGLAVAIAATILVLAACGTTPPSEPVVTTDGPSAAAPTATPSATPVVTLHIDDAAYLAGDAFQLPVGDAGADWTAPSTVPVMPNGRPAVRVAFLPASCASGDVLIDADPAPEDAWDTDLREEATTAGYTTASWPSAQVPQCAAGKGWTYLQVGYHPLAPLGSVHLVATSDSADPVAAVEVVPVFTSADATQPALTSTGFVAAGPAKGPEKPFGAKARMLATYGFGRATLPDGSEPTQFRLDVTGCGPVGDRPIVILVRVGEAPAVEVGQCSDGSMTSNEIPWPLPADGTPITVLATGGTTRSQVRISEFQWRDKAP